MHKKGVIRKGVWEPHTHISVHVCTIIHFHVNLQNSHSYHYSYFSVSPLIALIIVNWLPRSVDPSLPVICL